MRSLFPGHYQPSAATFQRMWQQGLFLVDANVLLGVYRYSDATVQQLLNTFRRVQERLWLPHQAALEYHRNLTRVIAGQQKPYKDALETIKSLRSSFRSERDHPFLPEELLAEADPILDKLETALSTREKARLDLLTADPLKDELADLFDGKVGDSYTKEQLEVIYLDGADRYSRKVPPGYEDVKSKESPDCYGDLVLWRQILVKAEEANSSIVFVTDDVKEDWFLRVAGRTLGPRPELIAEFKATVDGEFYMYTTSQFLRFANDYLEAGVPAAAINEVETKVKERTVARRRVKSQFRRTSLLDNLRIALGDPTLELLRVDDSSGPKDAEYGLLNDGRICMVPDSSIDALVIYRRTEVGWVIDSIGPAYGESLRKVLGSTVTDEAQRLLEHLARATDT